MKTEDLQNLKKELANPQKIVIIPHKNPKSKSATAYKRS